MSLLPNFDRPAMASKLSSEDHNRANKLHDAVIAAYANATKWRESVWAKEFSLLRTQDNIDDARIDAVLNWVVANMKKSTLVITSATQFRKHFLLIENASQKNTIVFSEDSIPPEIQPVYTRMLNVAAQYQWPESCKHQVQEFVGQTLLNYHKLVESLQEKCQTLQSNHPDKQLIRHVFLTIPSLDLFVTDWIIQTMEIVSDWENWNGSLCGLQFMVVRHAKKVLMPAANCYAFEGFKRIAKLMGLNNAD